MARVRIFTIPHYEPYPVHVALFTNVQNATYLRTQLLQANPDFDYAFLDAEMILSPTHLLTSIFLTLHALQTSRQKTRTPHSELVFRLSPNNNIGESYKKFGLGDSTTNLIAVKLPLSPAPEGTGWVIDNAITSESVSVHLGHTVQGTSVEIGELGDELGSWCNVDKVRKMYKVSSESGKGKKGAVVQGDAKREDEKKEMESVILGMIALKGS
ncbi:kinase binding protein CGI-121-domain-containing protein [Phaeosphaeriaceae sp. PMI808]|nr:kinase binding protein CGI-121-domain-containing protein [Phaeosphaeriaceae sp. PMI808]